MTSPYKCSYIGTERDLEYLLASTNVPGWTVDSKKMVKQFQKIWFFFCKYCWMFRVLTKFHDGMTFMEVVAKKQNWCSKKAIFESILEFWICFFFLPRLPRMSFHDETLPALETFNSVCHQKIGNFISNFLVYCSHQVHMCSWAE